MLKEENIACQEPRLLGGDVDIVARIEPVEIDEDDIRKYRCGFRHRAIDMGGSMSGMA